MANLPKDDFDIDEKDGGRECYYLDENGKKCDAALHDEILDSVPASVKRKEMQAAYERALKRGMSEEDARDLYIVEIPDD